MMSMLARLTVQTSIPEAPPLLAEQVSTGGAVFVREAWSAGRGFGLDPIAYDRQPIQALSLKLFRRVQRRRKRMRPHWAVH